MYYVAKVEGKRMWDDPKDIAPIIADLEKNKDQITGIELSSNSIGIECAKVLANAIQNLTKLEKVNYRDIFVSRLKEDLPISLELLMKAIMDKKIKILDLSDNAFGPTAIHSFDFFLKENATLEELHLENNGLGPEGAESVANSLMGNEKMKLKLMKLNRNRLENKGAIAFSKLFTKMETLEHIELFQNGIKEEGMTEVIKSFGSNKNLRVLKINDNLVKNASKNLIEVLPVLTKLEVVDISDSLLGNANGVEIFKSLAKCPELKEIYCNYNEIEKKKSQEEIMNLCLQMEKIKVVELKGNEINTEIYKKFKKDLSNKLIAFNCYSDEEDVDLEEDEEEDIVKKVDNINLNK